MDCSNLSSGDPNAFGCELQGLGEMTSGLLNNIDPAIAFLFLILIAAFVLLLFLVGARAVGVR
jgi:hypothetical protein